MVLPTVDDGDGDGVTEIVTGDKREKVSAVLADFGDYKKGPYTSRIHDLTNIMNGMFSKTGVNKTFDQITAWSVNKALWQAEPTVATEAE